MLHTPLQNFLMVSWIYYENNWRWLFGILSFCIALYTSGHIILNRRDYRAALWWVGVVWVAPLLGAFLYYHVGINRIKRKALSLRRQQRPLRLHRRFSDATHPPYVSPTMGHLYALSRLVDKVTEVPLLKGNRIEPLMNGDEAYPAMLEAIEQARESVSLSCYIFKNDRTGSKFIDALGRAAARGVETRVLVDDLGSGAWGTSVPRALRKAHVPNECFLPSFLPWRMAYMNLRNHRKLVVVDGKVGFTGSMNIHDENVFTLKPKVPVQDIQFRIEGPVVSQLQHAFVEDWYFASDEILRGPRWFPDLQPLGPLLARGVVDGPDEHFERLRHMILAALANARSSVLIVTPYFVPDLALVTALNLAAMSGIQVDIVLPEKNDLALVRWASAMSIGQVLERGCRVWSSPPPFDHSKLMVVDQTWALFGSSNWDTRSLRLNFEFNVECYNEEFGRRMDGIIREKISRSRPITLDEINGRSLPVRLRDGVARLFSPHL